MKPLCHGYLYQTTDVLESDWITQDPNIALDLIENGFDRTPGSSIAAQV